MLEAGRVGTGRHTELSIYLPELRSHSQMCDDDDLAPSMGLFFGIYKMKGMAVYIKIDFEFEGQKYEFGRIIGRLPIVVQQIYDVYAETASVPNKRLGFARALLLGEIEGCKVVDVHFEKHTNDKPA